MNRRPGYLLAGLLACLSACAHHPPPTAASEAESSQMAEIHTLERRISERKATLPGDSGSIASAGAGAAEAPAAQSPVQMSSGDSVPASSAGRCDGVCQAAEDICTCHRRICRLASEINDERSAGSCRRAQHDCEEASRHCATCH